MQDVPLTIASILRHAVSVNGDRTVTTALGDGRYRSTTYRELGEQVAGDRVSVGRFHVGSLRNVPS